MAALIGRSSKEVLLRVGNGLFSQQASLSLKESVQKLSKGKKLAYGLAGTALTGTIGLGIALQTAVLASDIELHPPSYPWTHNGLFTSYDHASIRRGYQVYKEVCASCHSLKYMRYREMIGVFMTEDEAKAEAAEIQVVDGPNDEGDMFKRPGKLSDIFPSPYANDEAAKTANAGALPPDLTYIVPAKHGGEDYIFSLLTSYCDAPAGVEIAEGMNYNPYFIGEQTAMAQAIYDEIVEYEDGTPNSAAQIAKDVCSFLRFTSEPEHDTRKRMSLQIVIGFSFIIATCYYIKRHKWSSVKNRKVFYRPKK